MSGSGRFCPRCGDSISDDGFAAPDARGNAAAELCRECYLEAIDLVSVPERVTVHLCTGCGSVRRDGTWEDIEDADYTDIAIQAVAERLRIHREAQEVGWGVEPIQRGPNELDMVLTVRARVAGITIEEDPVVAVDIAKETCPRCGRLAGDYYAGTVQIRASGREPADVETSRAVDIAHELTADDDRDAFVSEVIERPEGIDIRVSKNGLAARIAHRVVDQFGGTVDSSETLVTEDEEGEGVYRVAFAVRLPRFRPGDIVRPPESGAVLVQGDVRGRDLASGDPTTIDGNVEHDRLGSVEDVTETTLVTVEDENAVQVLDPDTAVARTIPRPPDLQIDGETVHVFKDAAGLYPIPTDVLEAVRS